ncbi:MAG TPA: hypothetical protein VGS11_00015, partial [Candidatus Bathyarchaeia archaeon]|nr:hypothetical protein [Candidatus Bathyarchaeia archaeon]
MREGTIHAWCAERRDARQLKFLLPFVGVYSLLLFVLVSFILYSLSPSIWRDLVSSGWFAYVFSSSVLTTAVSVIYLWMTGREMVGNVAFYDVSWVDKRELQGTLQISYINQKYRGRMGLV